MPRASRTSQAAAASAVAPDESLRAFYNTYDASSQPSTSTSTSAANNPVGDPLWTRRRRGSGRVASSSAARGDNANLNASTISNLTDVSVSVSSASLNSPGGETMQSSSHAESEASSYATRAIPGVIDEENEERQERGGEEEEEEDSDEVIVVTSRRSRAATARRGNGRARTRASRNQHHHEDDPEEHDEEDDQHMFSTSAVNDASTVSITNSQFSSHLLDESDEDLPGGDITGHQSRSYGAGEVDELLNATNEEVEAKAMLELGWNEIGNDRELFKVDLERWKKIDKDSEKFKTVGSAEYRESFHPFLRCSDLSKAGHGAWSTHCFLR